MTYTPPAYQSMVSPRSRRLRSIGLVLLVAAVTMALYGFFVVMPSLRAAVATQRVEAVPRIEERPASSTKNSGSQNQPARVRRANRAVAVKVLFVYGYWGVCGLLVIGMLFVAWLDTREVSRNYLNERRSVWLDAARNMPHDKEE
jgi:hypothetical protein